jgi:hypothetical protein
MSMIVTLNFRRGNTLLRPAPDARPSELAVACLMHHASRGLIAMTIGSIDNRERLNLDQIPGLGQRLHPQQDVGGLVVSEHRDPGR